MTTGTTEPQVDRDTRSIHERVRVELGQLLNPPVSTWLDPTARDGQYVHVLIYRRHNNAGPNKANFDLFVAVRPLEPCRYEDLQGLKVRLGGVVAEVTPFGLFVFYNLSDGWYDLQLVAE